MICIVDYGMGNLRSVSKALEKLGAQVKVSDSFRDIERSDKLVLPGVGEFGSAMSELKNRNLVSPILNHITKRKPFLGICLGLQLLLESSEESPRSSGLDIIKGKVKSLGKRIDSSLKVPQMGWNEVRLMRQSPLTKRIPKNSYFYFVHSYYAEPKSKQSILGVTDYGINFASILEEEPIFAVQFHPEKSQKTGLKILENFIKY